MMNKKAITLSPENNIYKIGTVTYQVAAFFDSAKPSLPDKLKRLLSEEIKNNKNHTFAKSQDGNVK